MKKTEYRVIGVMSGTSLDALDICIANYKLKNKKWQYKIEVSKSFNYSYKWIKTLTNPFNLSAEKMCLVETKYSLYISKKINKLLKQSNISYQDIDLISCHGHTFFHNPKKKYTKQICNGQLIASKTNIKTVCNFRNLDIVYGGTGAPLVPIGDCLMFSNYSYCVNIGGVMNISYKKNKKRVAFDICLANMGLNNIVSKYGLKYDKNGNISKKGRVNKELLNQLLSIDYHKKKGPKSMGKEEFNNYYKPILKSYKIPTKDKLATFVEFIATELYKVIKCSRVKKNKILITGGGAYNNHLINEIKKKLTEYKIIIPEKDIVEFKEALIFGLLGVLRVRKNINCLSSVTGAKKNSCTGEVFYP